MMGAQMFLGSGRGLPEGFGKAGKEILDEIMHHDWHEQIQQKIFP